MNTKMIRNKLNKDARKVTHFHLLLFAAFVCFALSPGLAFAHPPSDIALSYDGTSQTLKVGITHSSKSPDKHYIKKVEIIKNGTVVSAEDYKTQPNQDVFSYDYKVSVGANDVVEVKATCNVFGSEKKKLTAGPSKDLR